MITKEIKLKTGREITIRAVGMLTIRRLTGNIPVMKRDDAENAEAEPLEDVLPDETARNFDRAIGIVCAGSVSPVFQNTYDPETGCLSVDELSLSEFNELCEAISELSGMGGESEARPLSGTGKG